MDSRRPLLASDTGIISDPITGDHGDATFAQATVRGLAALFFLALGISWTVTV
jgi:hypothetical protein